uniref:C-type lectin domain-containing protein n=1 Tax=Panagrolaimus davidi TaxID=227884 RepID=A0A914QU08_9BILA
MATTTVAPPKRCLDNWSFYDATGYCYKVFHNATWENAENFCYSYGAHLTSIHSLEEDLFIASNGFPCIALKIKMVTDMISFDPNDHGMSWQNIAWIGLFTVTNQTDWMWIDHTPYNYSIWGPTRPCCSSVAAYCVGLRNGPVWGWPVGVWADDECDDIFGHFVCKKLAYQ